MRGDPPRAICGGGYTRISASLGSMALRVGAIVLNVPSTGPAAEFWKEALGLTADPGNPDFLAPPPGTPPTRIHLDSTDRTHLDLWVETSTPEAEVDRLVALGAERIEWTYPENADFVVLKAPDGTVFCVIG
jgi:Glyoxalase-like domain